MQFSNYFSNPIGYNSGTWYPSKVKIRTIGGYFDMEENPMVAAQFYERSGYIYSLLWMNPNSHTLVA